MLQVITDQFELHQKLWLKTCRLTDPVLHFLFLCVQSKALRERWLLDGAPSAGPEQGHVTRQLEQDQAKTRSLEETITRSGPKPGGWRSHSS